jgi:preprotein translocase subunit SecE
VSDEGNAADDVAVDGGETEDSRSGGRTAVVTKPAARPQRPTGKRSRQRMLDAIEEDAEAKESSEQDSKKARDLKESEEDSDTKKAKKGKSDRGKTGPTAKKKAKKPKKAGDRPANPFLFVYNYLKQVVAEMRKVIWPSRKQMLTYTGVVLAFLAFMVALVGLSDFGLTKLVMLVFG